MAAHCELGYFILAGRKHCHEHGLDLLSISAFYLGVALVLCGLIDK